MQISHWYVLCGVGALLVRVAQSLLATGMMRSKNSAGMVMRLVVDLALVTLAFWLVGAAIYESAGFSLDWRLIGAAGPDVDAAGFFFILVAMLTGTGSIAGVVGERSRFLPMCAVPLFLGGVLMPLALRWTLAGGWLANQGFLDYAGAAAIHLTAAATALVAAIIVGPRSGKFNRDGSSNAIPGHSLPLASSGVLLMVAGWIPYLLGFGLSLDSPGLPAMNLLLAGSAGAITSLAIGQWRYFKPDIHLVFAGLLGALVAIVPVAHTQLSFMAVLIGALAGTIVPAAMLLLDLRWRIDDVTGGIAVHGGGALLGLLAAPLAAPITWSQCLKTFGAQLLGITAILALTGAAAWLVLAALHRTIGLRSKEADEFDGLDLAEHDINSYPDFQQTMIKSYHLREA
jgi:ammonium transporter, Amt family